MYLPFLSNITTKYLSRIRGRSGNRSKRGLVSDKGKTPSISVSGGGLPTNRPSVRKRSLSTFDGIADVVLVLWATELPVVGLAANRANVGVPRRRAVRLLVAECSAFGTSPVRALDITVACLQAVTTLDIREILWRYDRTLCRFCKSLRVGPS